MKYRFPKLSKHIYMGFFLLFTSCKVGPDYLPPEISMPTSFIENKQDKTFIPNEENLVTWWNCFDDPFLNSLLEEAISNNFDYRIALEQVAEARSQYWVQFTQLLPEIDFDAQASRFHTSRSFISQKPASTTTTTSTTTTVAAPIGTPMTSVAAPAGSPPNTTTATTSAITKGATISQNQNFFQLGFDAIWEIDLFGKLRRAADASYDTYEAISETSHDVKIIILSEVAHTYSLICSFQQKVALQTQIVINDELFLSIASDKFIAGITPEQDLENALIILETDKASLKTLQTNLKENIYALAILLGKAPEKVINDFLIKRPIPIARGKIPSGLPADLLKRRHDIRSSERQLAAATEEVGVAVAALYPSLSISGSSSSFASNPLQGANYGLSSDKLNKLFKNQSRIWGIGGLLTVPIFDFGKRLAGIDVQLAIQRQAGLSYQKTVITALQEAETALSSYFDEEEREISLGIVEEANKKNYDLTLSLFEAGLADEAQSTQAKNMWLAAADSHTDSQQALTSNLIAVYKSLGGNW